VLPKMNALLAQCYCDAIDSHLIEPCCITRLAQWNHWSHLYHWEPASLVLRSSKWPYNQRNI